MAALRTGDHQGATALIPAVTLVVLVTFGQMLILPVTGDVAARLAGERHLGAHLGVLSTVGGLAVLITGPAAGRILESAPAGGAGAALPWIILALPPALAAGTMWWLVRDLPGGSVPP